jgi:hypothetical protein
MTFSDFTSISQVEDQLGVQFLFIGAMFPNIRDVELPAHYAATLEENV